MRWNRANASRAGGFFVICLHISAVLASYFGLVITGWVLDGASLVAILMLLVVFQPEVRHALVDLERALSLGRRRGVLTSVCRAISDAAFVMAGERLGALIVIAGKGPVSKAVAHGGIALDAEVSMEILEAIFLKGSLVHDGAVIIEADRISRAGVLLPLTRRQDIASHFGAPTGLP